MDFHIHTDPTVKIPHFQPYYITQAKNSKFEIQIKKLLTNGWVTDSHSRYAALIIFVKKPDTKLRMCIDYHGLNSIVSKNRYLLLYIEDLLDKLHGARVFTKLNLVSGYHQVWVHADDCHKTAFVAPDGFYEYKVIPFRLTNAPVAFIRMMYRIIRPYRWNAIVYLDDVLIFSQILVAPKVHVEDVLTSLRNTRQWLNRANCVFDRLKMSFVGFRVNRHGIHSEEKKVKAV